MFSAVGCVEAWGIVIVPLAASVAWALEDRVIPEAPLVPLALATREVEDAFISAEPMARPAIA